MKNVQGPGWKNPWKDPKNNDNVFFNEDEAVVSVDLSKRCDSHTEESFCRHCLPRLVAAVDAARRCIDPKAEALVEYVVDAGGPWPPYIALVTPMIRSGEAAPKAFAMKFNGSDRVMATKTLYTSKLDDYRFDGPVTLADYRTQSRVCDAKHIRAFSVRLKDGVSEAYARKLWEAKLSFMIDGEILVGKMFLKDLLGMKEFVFPRPMPDRCLIFDACALRDDQTTDPDKWLGYMLPNGSDIQVKLDDVPGGGGLIQIETSWHLANYTTKVELAKA